MFKAIVGNAWMEDLTFNAECIAALGPELPLPLTLPWWCFTGFPNRIRPQIPPLLNFGAELTFIRQNAIIHT
jgi:hypothetical protein